MAFFDQALQEQFHQSETFCGHLKSPYETVSNGYIHMSVERSSFLPTCPFPKASPGFRRRGTEINMSLAVFIEIEQCLSPNCIVLVKVCHETIQYKGLGISSTA